MAIYSATMSYHSRAKGRVDEHGVNWSKRPNKSGAFSTLAAAAYRAGESLTDERTGEVFDYRAKGGVVHSFIMSKAAPGTFTRESLWNSAEAAERDRANARVAREWRIALPHELTHAQRVALVEDIARALVDQYGVAVDASLHMPNREGDQRNHHAHILFTTRRVDAAGVFGAKTRELDDLVQGPEEVTRFRATIAAVTNRHLAAAGHKVTVDYRSHKERGLDQKPGIHEGRNATNARRRGRKLRESGEQLVNDRGHLMVMDWKDIDGGESRRAYNLRVGAAAVYTAQMHRDIAKKELAAAEKAYADLLHGRALLRKMQRAARAEKGPGVPRFRMPRGGNAEEKIMGFFAALLASFCASLLPAFTQLALTAVSAIIDSELQDDKKRKALRDHRNHMRRRVRYWEKVVAGQGEKGAAASAEKAAAARPGRGQQPSPAAAASVRKRRRRDRGEWAARPQDFVEPTTAADAKRRTRPQKTRWQKYNAARRSQRKDGPTGPSPI